MRPPPKFELYPDLVSSFFTRSSNSPSARVHFPPTIPFSFPSASISLVPAMPGPEVDSPDLLAPLREALPGATSLITSAMRLNRDGTAYTLCHRYDFTEEWILRGCDITTATPRADLSDIRQRLRTARTPRSWRSTFPSDGPRCRDIRPLLALRLLLLSVAHLTSLPIETRDHRRVHTPSEDSGKLPVTLHLFLSPSFYEVG